jgi:hypothetical protein
VEILDFLEVPKPGAREAQSSLKRSRPAAAWRNPHNALATNLTIPVMMVDAA